MKFLVTNDDGIDAPGIATLVQVASALGEVSVAAPAESQSYMGHRVTTNMAIPVTEEAPQRFRVGGTPADCVRLALTCLDIRPEWVLSGINEGGNLGADTYISGTVAAAREACLLGCPAIALSHYVAKGRRIDWDLAARRILPVLRELLARPVEPAVFWSVNLPHPPHEREDLEVVFCPLDFQPFAVRFDRTDQGYRYVGSYQDRGRTPGSDVDQCFAGRITVTALPLNVSAAMR